jgi:nucleotide-binding universal stress UspA family protein
MFERILLPIDGSELSEAAVEHAAALGEKFGATVIVLQVIDYEAVEGQRTKARENIDRVAGQLRDRGVTVETTIVEGGPGDAICAAVEALDCDTVVMATHGRSGLKRAVLGSVADHVARNTPDASVLLIRPVAARD